MGVWFSILSRHYQTMVEISDFYGGSVHRVLDTGNVLKNLLKTELID